MRATDGVAAGEPARARPRGYRRVRRRPTAAAAAAAARGRGAHVAGRSAAASSTARPERLLHAPPRRSRSDRVAANSAGTSAAGTTAPSLKRALRAADGRAAPARASASCSSLGAGEIAERAEAAAGRRASTSAPMTRCRSCLSVPGGHGVAGEHVLARAALEQQVPGITYRRVTPSAASLTTSAAATGCPVSARSA